MNTQLSTQYILSLDDTNGTLEKTGGKGTSLVRLANAGLPVPDGFTVTTDAYRQFVDQNHLQPKLEEILESIDPSQPSTLEKASARIGELFLEGDIPPQVANAIVQAYGELHGRNPAVAVRSSATAEDLPEASFAGQQESFLNVSGADAVLEATRKCWASLWTARAIGYRARQDIPAGEVALAVVIQLLVDAEAAGILFTANPVDGNRDQVVISASWGLGEAVVGGKVNPDSITVDKATGQVLARETGDKQVMTVRTDGSTQEQPVPESLRQVPVLDDQAAAELTRLAVEIEELYEMPMDIEWALSDGKFAIVQARPITGLPEAYVPPPDDWEFPDPKGRYMRASIVDMMPDPLSPLFGTMGLSTYNQGMIDGLESLLPGKKNFLPEDLITTVQDYAYMKVDFSAGEWWGMLSVLGPAMPRLIRQGPAHFREVALPEYQRKVESLEVKPAAEMSAEEIWQDAHQLLKAAMDFLAILQVDTLGASAGSEGLFTLVYNRFFRQEGDPPASAFLMGYDTIAMQIEKSLYDLAQWAGEQPGLREHLLSTPAAQVAQAFEREEAPAAVPVAMWSEFARRLDDHLEEFGYVLYDLDFERPIPADDPAPPVETVRMFLRGQGANPYERQERLAREREQATENLLARARGPKGWAVRKTLGWAQSMGQVREDSIASIGLAYPRLRELLKELGRRMAQAGAFEDSEDIFWLEESEVEERLTAIERGEALDSMQETIDTRKKVQQAAEKIMPPTQLPPSKTYMGLPVEYFVPSEAGREGNHLKGVAASSGKVTGTAYVLHGPEDFDDMKPGGILVAKLTTPAWTPLFAMAGGVVTDIGGPLSHGSIVAREYGIPAVLGTGAATRVIETGQEITVDGDAGQVILE